MILTKASDISPVSIDWLWKHWIATRRIQILAGAPGVGKTTLALNLAAILSSGGHWPDGTTATPRSVVIWSGEDQADDVLRPRLEAQGADLDRIHIVSGMRVRGRDQPFDPAEDLSGLMRTMLAAGDVGLLILDPVVSVVKGDSHKNAEVRRAFQPVQELATKVGCAVLGITHFSKGTQGLDAVERVTGSVAFGAVSRLVLVASRAAPGDDGKSDQHDMVLVRAKTNISPDGDGFRYGVEGCSPTAHPDIETSRVVWGQALHGHAEDLLAGRAPSVPMIPKAERQVRWLRDQLKDGPVAADLLMERAAEQGWSRQQMYAARKRGSGVDIDQRAGGSTWYRIDQLESASGPSGQGD